MRWTREQIARRLVEIAENRSESTSEKHKRMVLELLRAAGEPMTAREISEVTGIRKAYLTSGGSYSPLTFLVAEGKVGRFRRGSAIYYFPDPPLTLVNM